MTEVESSGRARQNAILSAARRAQMYQSGDKVKILRGQYAGQVMTVRVCTANEISLVECLKSQSMSKENVEPAESFTKDELMRAEFESRNETGGSHGKSQARKDPV